MSGTDRVLVAEDQSGVRSFLVAALEEGGYSVAEAGDGIAAIRALEDGEFAVVITDLKMPGADGMAVLDHVSATAPDTAVIVLTAFGTIEGAVEAMRRGAADFLTKPVESPEVLRMAVARALETRRLARDNERLRRDQPGVRDFDGVVHADPAMAKVVEMARAVAASDATVLLLGESGTGKEVLAQAIHAASRGPRSPFVAVNCAALPGELLESELFGHEKGAFTGATAQRLGRFELASGGTLFLDEIGEMALGLQAKLLRVLQEGTFERVGGTRTLHADARLLAATNRDLKQLVGEGRFREDLYYRINVFPITIPPLRERRADILPLARHLLAGVVGRGDAGRELPRETAALLQAYAWPGNVRELANVLERGLILSRGGALLPEHLPADVVEAAVQSSTSSDEPAGSLKDVERQAILEALEAEDGNRRRAAARLGISLRTLQYRLREYGLTRG